jgi:transposase
VTLVVLRLLAALACPIGLRLVALGRQWCCRVAFTLPLFAFNRSHPDVDIYGPWVQETVVAMTFPALGFLILSRRHDGSCPEQFRRIATRYEKRAANYLAMLTVAAITLWLWG